MLIDREAIRRAAIVVDASRFYDERHALLFSTMVALAERGDAVDPITLAHELERRGELDAAGGKDYIGFLVDAVPTSANVEYHAKIVCGPQARSAR